MLWTESLFSILAVDDRCSMELDETDPNVWARLESATQDYIGANESSFQVACDCLEPPSQGEDTWFARHKNNGRFSNPGRASSRGTAVHN